MSKDKNRKHNVSIKLNDDEKRRIELFSQQRDLTISEYMRMSALGHRIKPTVVNFNNESVSADVEELQTENEQLKMNIKRLSPIMKAVKQIQNSIGDNGYVEWKTLTKEDKDALILLKNLKFAD